MNLTPREKDKLLVAMAAIVARNRLAATRGAGESAYADLAVLPMGETVTRYHVAIDVDDRAGVLAAVAQAFA